VPATNFLFSVQAIDNAYHGGAQCVGNGSGNCAEVQIEKLTACSNEVVPLVTPAPVYWFSFSKGFLGVADHYELEAASQDTVFYYNPEQPGCDGLHVWTVVVNDDTTRVEISDRAVCEGDQVRLGVEDGWSTIAWSSLLKGDLGSADSINYVAMQPDTIFTNLANPEGCTLLRKTAVQISKPVIVLAGDSHRLPPPAGDGRQRHQPVLS
jgi:hypothetical protein